MRNSTQIKNVTRLKGLTDLLGIIFFKDATPETEFGCIKLLFTNTNVDHTCPRDKPLKKSYIRMKIQFPHTFPFSTILGVYARWGGLGYLIRRDKNKYSQSEQGLISSRPLTDLSKLSAISGMLSGENYSKNGSLGSIPTATLKNTATACLSSAAIVIASSPPIVFTARPSGDDSKETKHPFRLADTFQARYTILAFQVLVESMTHFKTIHSTIMSLMPRRESN